MEQGKISKNEALQRVARGSTAAISSRVGASASALIHESVFRPNPRSIVDELTASTSNGAKSNTPPVPSGPSATRTSPPASRASRSFTVGIGVPDPTQHAFRSHWFLRDRQAVEAQFALFLTGGQDQSRTERPEHCAAANVEPSQYVEASARSPGNAPGTVLTLATPSAKATRKHDLGNDQADGAAVVALLSDPSFNVDDVPEYQSTSVDRGGDRIVEGLLQSRGGDYRDTLLNQDSLERVNCATATKKGSDISIRPPSGRIRLQLQAYFKDVKRSYTKPCSLSVKTVLAFSFTPRTSTRDPRQLLR
ncbi:MAG: hypothetical protein Q9216_001013 [Gyalolechia sp. 2 TL-2023]